MSIRKKVIEDDLAQIFTQRLESTLFYLLDDDDPVNIYMLTEIGKLLKIDVSNLFPSTFKSGAYNLKVLSQGDIDRALNVAEALYETCIRFQKFDLALIVNSEVSRAINETSLPLNWIDGKFIG
ncbi:hypothetical protein [Mucilaginibacter agri]|uniref:Uncharacterized protein n=1 Tax=Mucilaginibacter agri TaxID=2695265 RepID=A0A965ZDG2_9SPHI|nr:hypothetical protein [Mucilaginibacter agri]NCD68690.1 hypothetical protein [Mucilaginibacter agri]